MCKPGAPLTKSVARALDAATRAHGAQIDGLEEAAYDALIRVYGGLSSELERQLYRVANGERAATFTAVHNAQVADQIGQALNNWAASSGDVLAAQTREAVGTGLKQLAREVLLAEEAAQLPGSLLERLNTWAPVVPVESVAYLAESGNLILANTRPEVATAVNTALAESMALGESMGSVVRRMRSSLAEETWRLRRIARTEINAAANYGHQGALTQTTQRFPELGLQKQWLAFRDNRTSQICLALDGLIVQPDANFTTAGLTYTTEVDGVEVTRSLPPFTNRTPPAHPNCRSRIVAYSPRWAGI